MKLFTRNDLRAMAGTHVAAQPHMRIHILEHKNEGPKPPIAIRHGELLLIVVGGFGAITVNGELHAITTGDQAVLTKGDKFGIQRGAECPQLVVQYVWTPGEGSCDLCGVGTTKKSS